MFVAWMKDEWLLSKKVYYSDKYRMWLCDIKYAKKFKTKERLLVYMEGFKPNIEEII